jgi:hypothetical protein
MQAEKMDMFGEKKVEESVMKFGWFPSGSQGTLVQPRGVYPSGINEQTKAVKATVLRAEIHLDADEGELRFLSVTAKFPLSIDNDSDVGSGAGMVSAFTYDRYPPQYPEGSLDKVLYDSGRYILEKGGSHSSYHQLCINTFSVYLYTGMSNESKQGFEDYLVGLKMISRYGTSLRDCPLFIKDKVGRVLEKARTGGRLKFVEETFNINESEDFDYIIANASVFYKGIV